MKADAPAAGLVLVRSRLADLVELTKPRIAVLVLFTVGAGAILAQPADMLLVLHAVLGSGLLAAGASVLNQVLERQSDARMRRTEHRPLPAGRLHPLEGLALGLALSAAGLAYLALTARHGLAVWIGAFTLVSYVLVYTPLKRYTTLNTLIGAVPGALPPVIGWAAVRGTLEPEIIALFFVIFLWQVPHFLAIAWIYRDDYARAGLKMLPVLDPNGRATGRQMILYCLALIPAGLMPLMVERGGWVLAVGGVALGLLFLRAACRFAAQVSDGRARKVLHASLFYLPGMLALWLLDHWMRLSL
ncbi:MAG: heme o synthase [Gemmataceae bacterium]